MVSFSDSSEITSTVDIMRMMDEDVSSYSLNTVIYKVRYSLFWLQIQNATGLERHMRNLDEEILVNPQYVQKLSKVGERIYCF